MNLLLFIGEYVCLIKYIQTKVVCSEWISYCVKEIYGMKVMFEQQLIIFYVLWVFMFQNTFFGRNSTMFLYKTISTNVLRNVSHKK